MSEQKPQKRTLNLAGEGEVPTSKAERSALELKIAELTGVAGYLTQSIAVSQGQAERLEKDVEDLLRHKRQAETELKAQQELGMNMRREIHNLEMEIKKGEGTIANQQERIRVLTEAIDTAERRGKQAIKAFHDETDSKLKAIKHEFEAEKERITIELETHRSQTHAEMKLMTEEFESARKKQGRNLELEYQDVKRKTEDLVAKLLQEGRNKNEALIKATEATALEVHRESESSAKRLIYEANQKSADIIRTAQLEAEEVRRRTHNAEVSFLKEKNAGLAEMKLMVNNAKEEAQAIVAAAMKEASEIQYKVEQENEAKVAAANKKLIASRKEIEQERQETIEKTSAQLHKHAKDQEALIAQRKKEGETQLAEERKRFEEEARGVLNSARERAQAIIETASNEKSFKYEEIKAQETAIIQTANQSAIAITQDAEKIALKIVEEARNRARTIENTVESIVGQANIDAERIKEKANAYAEKVKTEIPDPEIWEGELAKVRQQEQDRLQSMLEPTVKNYLKAIDMQINDIFMALPSKYQSNQIIQDFVEAIANIQQKKNQIKFSDMIPKSSSSSLKSVGDPPLSQQTALKKSS